MNLIKWVNRGNVLKFGNLLSYGYGGLATDEEFQINIFKIVQKIRQKTQGHGM